MFANVVSRRVTEPFPSHPLLIPAAKADSDRGLAFCAFFWPFTAWPGRPGSSAGAESESFLEGASGPAQSQALRSPITNQGPSAWAQGPGTKLCSGGARDVSGSALGHTSGTPAAARNIFWGLDLAEAGSPLRGPHNSPGLGT